MEIRAPLQRRHIIAQKETNGCKISIRTVIHTVILIMKNITLNSIKIINNCQPHIPNQIISTSTSEAVTQIALIIREDDFMAHIIKKECQLKTLTANQNSTDLNMQFLIMAKKVLTKQIYYKAKKRTRFHTRITW